MRFAGIFLCSSLFAGEIPRGLFRGAFEAVEGTAVQGAIRARDAAGELATCAYDSRSYIEREHERVTALRLIAGDRIEIVADYRNGSRSCYARTVHVLPPTPPSTRRTQQIERRRQVLLPKGDLTLAGVVTRLADGELTLRTTEGYVALRLRPDTRYLGEGDLTVNRRVSIQAGRALAGGLEAYQVSWADLLIVP